MARVRTSSWLVTSIRYVERSDQICPLLVSQTVWLFHSKQATKREKEQKKENNIYISADQDQSYILPYRGFLIELIPVGCTPESPPVMSELAFLVSYNQSHASYMCKVSTDESNILFSAKTIYFV